MGPTVAVLGASGDRKKFGNRALRAFRHRGFRVIPINLEATLIEGLPAFRSVLDVSHPIDTATIYLNPESGLSVLDELVEKKVREVWLNPGADEPQVVAKARSLGLEIVLGCSIVAIGEDPGNY